LYRRESSYFRFYEDGTVIGASTTGEPDQIIAWFKKGGSSNLSEGTYKRDENYIAFSTSNDLGTVKYSGSIQKDILVLDSTSMIIGFKKRDGALYQFTEIDVTRKK